MCPDCSHRQTCSYRIKLGEVVRQMMETVFGGVPKGYKSLDEWVKQNCRFYEEKK